MICSRLIWPTAHLTLRQLLTQWWMTPPVLAALAAMLFVDVYFIVRVGAVDRRETEQYLDEAEHWLTSWKGPLIQMVTLGYINPRQMVYVEVRKAVDEGRGLLHRTLWWVSAQAGLRTLYGLLLWLAWAVHSPAAGAVGADPPAAMLPGPPAARRSRRMTDQLTPAVQDYLKAIHALGGADADVSPDRDRGRTSASAARPSPACSSGWPKAG